jgi:hypothetical protein
MLKFNPYTKQISYIPFPYLPLDIDGNWGCPYIVPYPDGNAYIMPAGQTLIQFDYRTGSFTKFDSPKGYTCGAL